MNVLMNEIFEAFFHQIHAQQKKIEINVFNFFPDDKDKIFSDRSRIEQVLIKLLSNALKFTTSGFINFGYEKNNSDIKFFITDSGCGIPKDKFEIIFERFRQVDDSLTRKFGGTGLGLTIVKKITERMGGKIWLKSQLEVGTTFYFTIPKN